jgi:hypothetical protein
MAILKSIPPGLLTGLPPYDKRAITAVLGKPVLLVEYDDVGRAELEFTDKNGRSHTIWVNTEFVRAAVSTKRRQRSQEKRRRGSNRALVRRRGRDRPE